MTIKYIFFYAVPDDIVPTLKIVEASTPVKYVQIDILPSPNRDIYLECSQLPHPGIAGSTSGIGCQTYMVSPRDIKNHLHFIKANDGRELWGLRNGDNEESVLLTLGGLSKAGSVIEGQMATLHKTGTAQQLMRWFLSALKKQNFVRFKGCWIGPAALDMLKAGKRLTQAEQSPPEYDLKWPGPA